MKRERRKRKNDGKEDGFTFVETLAVLAVAAVLAAGAGISAVHVIQFARETAARESIGQFKAALQSYYIDCGRFPTTQQGLEALWQKPVLVPVPESWNGPYLDRELQTDPWGADYVYFAKGSASFPTDAVEGLPFAIISYGADGVEGGTGNDADIFSWK